MLTYIIISTGDLDLVDFSQVKQSSQETVRKNLQNTECLLSYEGSEPSSLQSIEKKSYNNLTFFNESEIISIMASDDWKEDDWLDDL